METTPPPMLPAKEENKTGCLAEFGWFFSGAVLPIGSLSFYRKASQRRVGLAILFFLIFTMTITALRTATISIPMFGLTKDIQNAYRNGDIPAITIRDGVAEAMGKQPFVLENKDSQNGMVLIAVDTTGEITSIDKTRYDQGFLMTGTELHILSQNGEYQRLPLSQLNEAFNQNPLSFNGETVSRAWIIFAIFLTLVLLIIFFLWDSVLRLMVIAVIALLMWGVGSLIRPRVGFGPFIISGLYAVVPAVYLSYLFDRIDVHFLGLQTLLLMFFWSVGLAASLVSDRFFSPEAPARLWTALFGIPMLVMIIIDLFLSSPSLYWKIALWAVALLTGLALIGLRLFFHFRDMQKPGPTPEPPLEPGDMPTAS